MSARPSTDVAAEPARSSVHVGVDGRAWRSPSIMIVIAAQQMFINDQDLGSLLWIMVPAAVAAAFAA